MNRLRKTLVGLGALLLALGLLLWFLPARWAMPWIEPHLHGLQLQQVHGSLWQGDADQVLSRDGTRLGKVHWQLSRRALLGESALQLEFSGPALSFSGSARQLRDQKMELHDVTARADVGRLGLTAPSTFGQPSGILILDVSHALLQGGWPLELQLTARWEQAAAHTLNGEVAFGTLALQAQSRNGIIQAQLHDLGDGPLAANGQLQLSPLGWRLDATLASRQTDPRLDRWLAQFGAPAADGSVQIHQTRGLASALPAPDLTQEARNP